MQPLQLDLELRPFRECLILMSQLHVRRSISFLLFPATFLQYIRSKSCHFRKPTEEMSRKLFSRSTYCVEEFIVIECRYDYLIGLLSYLIDIWSLVIGNLSPYSYETAYTNIYPGIVVNPLHIQWNAGVSLLSHSTSPKRHNDWRKTGTNKETFLLENAAGDEVLNYTVTATNSMESASTSVSMQVLQATSMTEVGAIVYLWNNHRLTMNKIDPSISPRIVLRSIQSTFQR